MINTLVIVNVGSYCVIEPTNDNEHFNAECVQMSKSKTPKAQISESVLERILCYNKFPHPADERDRHMITASETVLGSILDFKFLTCKSVCLLHVGHFDFMAKQVQ